MPVGDPKSLRAALNNVSDPAGRFLWGVDATICLGDLQRGSSLGGGLSELTGRSVLVKTRNQISAALALIELDSVARRLVICPPDIRPEYLRSLAKDAAIDAVVFDQETSDDDDLGIPLRVKSRPAVAATTDLPANCFATEWVLLTSGTTGVPKMVVHSLAGLTGAIKSGKPQPSAVIWGTFYDMRRYGGLQVFFRAIVGGASFIISGFEETLADYMIRLRDRGATHVLGTPTHWRRALMSPTAPAIPLRYVRLSGEIADQAILDNLRSVYPSADIVHAYASTEAGVGFEVGDGLEGFPLSILNNSAGDVEMKIQDGSLRIRSTRSASRYIGGRGVALVDKDGFVDTADMVEVRNGRYYFLGRMGGIINVGGLKVHPEEVEAIINRHPDVRISHVRARNNPITGSIVVADVVLKDVADRSGKGAGVEKLKREILEMCSGSLAQHKVPVVIKFVPALNYSAAGKLARHA